MQDYLFGPPRDERERRSRQLIERCGYGAAAVTLLPIPGTEFLGVLPIHVGMVVGLGNEHGQQLTRETAVELLGKIGATVGLSLVGSKIATTASKLLLPGFGGILTAPLIFASTIALGTVARLYFETGGQLSEREMRRVFDDVKERAKSAFDPARARSDEARAAAREAQEHAQAESEGTSAHEPKARPSVDDLATRLATLEELHERGSISDAEYERRREAILDEV
ncbi:MAG: DUF697 domain-containing protein [Dehalococcoidia bacterium]|nr:DUF697 domain-containing protein [Dehalococcoidia bacterium]